jgi:hypothetical protein
MTEVSAPMTGPNKAVLFASIGIAVGWFLLAIETNPQNQFPAVIWAYTAWKTYKQDFPTLVFAQKVLAGIAALAVIWGAVTVGDAKSELILGLSPSDMILGGLISFIAHFWLLNFFKGQLPYVSRSAVANQELLEKEDSAARITQTAQQETQVDSDPQIKQSDSTSGATASTEQAQPVGNKGVWITTIAVVMFLGLLVLGYEDLQEQGSADSSTLKIYEVSDPTGRILRVEGASPPNPMQIKALFEKYDAEQAEQREPIYNACILDKSEDVDMNAVLVARAVYETCWEISKNPSWSDRLWYD